MSLRLSYLHTGYEINLLPLFKLMQFVFVGSCTPQVSYVIHINLGFPVRSTLWKRRFLHELLVLDTDIRPTHIPWEEGPYSTPGKWYEYRNANQTLSLFKQLVTTWCAK